MTEATQTGKIIITLESEEVILDQEEMDVSFDSPPQEILEKISQAVQEEKGISLRNDEGDFLYKVRKVTSSQNIYLYPDSVAG